jgi:hypothetical protein
MSMHRGTMRVRCSSSSWGGTAIVSTPYHGYWKNLALAVTGRMDAHFTALWDHGHIKFWSIATLGELLREAGFVDIRFERVGQVPPLAKAMRLPRNRERYFDVDRWVRDPRRFPKILIPACLSFRPSSRGNLVRNFPSIAEATRLYGKGCL